MNEKDSASEVEFVPPKDFTPPENTSQDKDWDMVCSFRTKPDGRICMTKLGDTDMPGYGSKKDQKHEESKETKPDYSEYSQSIMQAGNAAGSGVGAGPQY